MDHCINIICSWFFRPDFLSLLFKLLFDKVRKLACLVSGSTGKPTNIRPFHLHTSQTPADKKHLPAKKRKIPDRPTQIEWIGLLTEEHRENILTKKELRSDIMNHVQVILKKQFPDIQELQATENTPVSYDNNNMGKYHFKFQRATSLAAQIYHNRKFHWVAAAKVDGQNYVFDSLFNGSLSPSLQIQLASIYGGDFKQYNTSSIHTATDKQRRLRPISQRQPCSVLHWLLCRKTAHKV